MTPRFPSKCKVCGDTVKSRIHATHHTRLCKKKMIEKIVAVISMPMMAEVSCDDLTVGAWGCAYAVHHRTGKKVKERIFMEVRDAAGYFLELMAELRSGANKERPRHGKQ